HTIWPRDWSSDVCSSDLIAAMKSAWSVAVALGLMVMALAAPQAALAQVKTIGDEGDLSRSVVKIFTVSKRPNYFQPWDAGYQDKIGIASWREGQGVGARA